MDEMMARMNRRRSIIDGSAVAKKPTRRDSSVIPLPMPSILSTNNNESDDVAPQ